MSETTNEHTAGSERLKLACPYCQGKLFVTMEQAGNGYMTYETPSGFECYTTNCGAEWDLEGELTHQPSFVLYPDLYNKPESAK